MRILAERAQRTRERRRVHNRNRWKAKQALLRSSRPELLAASRGIKTRQTTLAPKGRSMGRIADIIHCLNSDTSRNLTIDIYAAAPIRRPDVGYANAQKALRDHIDEEDRKTYAELMGGVNESGTLPKQQPHEVCERLGVPSSRCCTSPASTDT